jgi:hypothetical protein
MAKKERYSGGCHCGAVRFEVEADLADVISCNCSICSTKGILWTMVPETAFTLVSGEGKMTEYRFHKRMIRHLFCATCGAEAFAPGTDPATGSEMVGVNVRCLDGVDLESLKLTPFDGKAL